jgi:hypothetical protein
LSLRLTGAATKASAPNTIPITFVWTHVRQALQHEAASGACSPSFAAAWPAFSVAICFTLEAYSRTATHPFKR